MGSALLRRLWNAAAALALLLLLAVAVLAMAVRIAGWMEWDVASPVERILAERLETPVVLDSAELRWRGLYPELRLTGLRLGGNGEEGFYADRLAVMPAWRRTLRAGELRWYSLDATGLRMTLREGPQGWGVAGLDAPRTLETRPDALLPTHGRVRSAAIRLLPKAGPPLQFQSLDVRLARRVGGYRLGVAATGLPDAFRDRSATLYGVARWATGGMEDAELFLSLPEFDVEALSAYGVPTPVTGWLGGSVWLTLGGGVPIEALIDGRAAALAGPSQDVVAESASGLVRWVGTPGHWRADLDAVRLLRPGEEHEFGRAVVRSVPEKMGRRVAVTTEWLPLEPLAATAAAVVGPGGVADRLKPLRPRGEFRAQGLSLSLDREHRPYAVFGGAQFREVAVEPVDRWPGFHGAGGDLRFHGRRLTGSVALEETDLRMPWLFREPLPAITASGEIYGAIDDEGGWGLVGRDFAVRNPASAGGGRWFLQGGPSAGVDHLFISAHLAGGEAAQVPRYLPAGVMPPPTVAWLDRALVEGRVERADLLIMGDPAAFPFEDGGGVFDVRGRVREGVLAFHPDWPPLEEVSVELGFRNLSMEITEGRGRIAGNPLEDVEVRIGDFREPVLEVRGRSDSDAADALALLKGSPLGRGWIGEPIPLDMGGPLGLDLQFGLPLREPAPEDLIVDGRVRLDDVWFELAPWVNAERLSGDLSFDQRGIGGEEIAGYVGGVPARFSARTAKIGSRDRIEVDATLSGTPATLLGVVERDPPFLRGSAEWRVRTRLPAFLPRPIVPEASIVVTSSLRGVALDLPPPFAKPEAGSLPLRLDIGFSAAGLESYWWSLGDGLLRGGAAAGPQGRPASLVVRSGPGPVRLPSRGSRFDVDWDEWDVEALLRWMAENAGGMERAEGAEDAVGTASSWVPRPVQGQLLVGEVRLGERGLGPLQLDVSELDEAWPWRVEAWGGPLEGVAGPDGEGGWAAELTHLDIPLPERGDGGDPAADVPPADPPARRLHVDPVAVARRFPELSLQVEELRFDGRPAGSLEVFVTPTESGLEMSRLLLAGEVAQAIGGGGWQVDGTHLWARLEAPDVGALLALLGQPEAVRLATADLDVDLSWPAPPWALQLKDIVGRMELEMARGRLKDVQPGVGRLVGLLSLSMLPRRVFLDFTDLVGEGFAFDTLHAEFELGDEQAVVRRFEIDGPSARVEMDGRMDLAERVYDNRIHAEPRIGGALPLIGGIVSGGVGVVGGWVTEQLLGGRLDRFTARDYTVTGPWDEPVVERVRSGD